MRFTFMIREHARLLTSKSAGKDLNPDEKKHGLLHPKGAHAGDLPNLIVEEDETVKAELRPLKLH